MCSKQGPWATYEPTRADPWSLRNVAHLHRRAGLGATWAELQRDLKDGTAASVDRLLRPPEADAEERDILASLRDGILTSPGTEGERLKAWWLYRILYHPDRLREKLTLFWHGHFATSDSKVQNVPLMLRQNELLRRHALGKFPNLLTEIIADPAMLVWLDGGASRKERPNENFAREFLELFTLGVGHYTEADIREAARAFTGWVPAEGERGFRPPRAFRYDPAQSDGGVKTFLGETGAWTAADIVRITLKQPACAEFLCRKLYRFFVSDGEDPPPELLGPLAEELRNHHYSIGHLVGVILRSRQFYSKAAYRRVFKSPVEFSAGLVRALEVPRSNLRLPALAEMCGAQGQDLFYPPNVKGWDGGSRWINVAALLARSNWVADVVWGALGSATKPRDPSAWAKACGIAPDKTVDGLIELLMQGDLDGEARALVRKTGQDGKPDSLRKALQLILHSPEYHLA
jgi:uncharacterized protein (DUF1800 family)